MDAKRYPIAAAIRQFSQTLGIDLSEIVSDLGLPASYCEGEEAGVDAMTYFRLADLAARYMGGVEGAFRVAEGAAKGPLQSTLLAFSASPNTATGLKRLAVFKPLMAPIRLLIEDEADGLSLGFEASHDSHQLPPFTQVMELAFFTELIRTFTAHKVLPREVVLPKGVPPSEASRSYFGGVVRAGEAARLTLSRVDADRPLLTRDTEFYSLIEAQLLSRLRASLGMDGIADQVRTALVDMLPSGRVSIEQVAQALRLSKRTLQRKLSQDGLSFQQVLDDTRAGLAMTYLRDQGLSIQEVSYLLAFSDPNSFHRAFRLWTGMTPAQARLEQSA